MYPKRFAESCCLKCHHDVTELEPSERFPDPPAPKLIEGFRLIQQVGCFGCHEINGFDGPNKRIGPDLRSEPNYTAAAEALLAGGGLNDQQKAWAEEVSREPIERRGPPLAVTVARRTANRCPATRSSTKRLVNLLDDVETPGQMRKVGPSLRHVASKLDPSFLYSWVRKPTDFRPSTKMPQFFGQWDHLDGVGLHEAERVRAVRDSRHRRVPAGFQPAVRVRRASQGGRRQAVGRARQNRFPGALPGLPPAQRLPGRHDGARARPVADRRQAGQGSQSQRRQMALHLAAQSKPVSPAHADAQHCCSSRSRDRTAS